IDRRPMSGLDQTTSSIDHLRGGPFRAVSGISCLTDGGHAIPSHLKPLAFGGSATDPGSSLVVAHRSQVLTRGSFWDSRKSRPLPTKLQTDSGPNRLEAEGWPACGNCGQPRVFGPVQPPPR